MDQAWLSPVLTSSETRIRHSGPGTSHTTLSQQLVGPVEVARNIKDASLCCCGKCDVTKLLLQKAAEVSAFFWTWLPGLPG